MPSMRLFATTRLRSASNIMRPSGMLLSAVSKRLASKATSRAEISASKSVRRSRAEIDLMLKRSGMMTTPRMSQ